MHKLVKIPAIRAIMIFGFIASLLGCGDGKPGFFSSNGYHIGKDKVWYKNSLGMDIRITEIVGADAKTFVVQSFTSKVTSRASEYGKDQSSIYYGGSALPGCDVASFEYVGGGYSKDKNRVYYTSDVLCDDVAHFEMLDDQFAKDAARVYFGNSIFSEDAAHFKRIGDATSNYYTDRYKCWYGIYELKGIDPKKLRYIGPDAATDETKVFYQMNEVEGADVKSYQILDKQYTKDARQVYREGQAIAGVDPATFRILDQHYTLDHQQCYYDLQAIPMADPATFQLVDEFYAKDAHSVFISEKRIEGADPATFRVLNGNAGCSCDAHYAYNMENRIQGVNAALIPSGARCKSCNETGITY